MIREKRVAKRQPLRYTAWVALTPEQRHGCVVSDVSETGARIDVQDSSELPDHFVLMLTSNGSARRFCRVMWRKSSQVGVQFTRTMAEAAAPKLAPKADADAQAAADAAPATAQHAAEPIKTA
jgi:hypothetical protein